MPQVDVSESRSPQFQIEPPSRIVLTMNATMAGNLARFILASFCDGDPPSIFALAKKLEREAGGAGTAVFEDDEEDSHAAGRTAKRA